jgi:hypothetical protein
VNANTDPTGSFRTHAGYLKAIERLSGFRLFTSEEATLNALATRIRSEPGFSSIQTRASGRAAELRRRLRAAWGTELLLSLTGEYAPEDLVGLGNSWGAVQTYYAAYHAVQALVVARGDARPESHGKTQKLFIDQWVTPGRTLGPWSLAASAAGYENLPSGKSIDEQIHPWTRCDSDTCWDIVAKAYRTTRDEAVSEAFQRKRDQKTRQRRRDWEMEEQARLAASKRPRKIPVFGRANLTVAERQVAANGVRPQGFLDYLYRLRMRAQYEDATMFTDGPESPSDSALVYASLRRITASTLLLHELWIRQIVGEPRLRSLTDEWLATSTATANPVAGRYSLIFP